MLHKTAGIRLSLKVKQTGQSRGNDLKRGRIFPLFGDIIEQALFAIQIPFPRLIQCAEGVFDIIQIFFIEAEQRLLGEIQHVAGFIDPLNRQPGFDPAIHHHNFVAGLEASRHIAGRIAELHIAVRPLALFGSLRQPLHL
ncbi:MAG: hypothetical protein BWY83_03281 [bacterium ADurb.Bin478]|nr:MAG: hypothetical protein BWY83_03281 [bacterium ADurb.Bin478]